MATPSIIMPTEHFIFVNDDGKIILDLPIHYRNKLIEGIYEIYNEDKGKYNILNMNTGKLLCKEWYKRIGNCFCGYCVVSKYEHCTYADINQYQCVDYSNNLVFQ